MKNVLITGGTGFLGSYMAKRVLQTADSVTIVTLDIKQKTTFKSLNLDTNKKINLVRGDIRDFNFIKLLFNEYEFDTVFHLGALSEVKKCQPNPKLTFETNVMGTINILEAARIYGTKAVAVSSSDKAYGSGEVPYLEDYAMNGKGIYEVSKSCTDLIARSYYSNYGVPVVVTRCSNLYGGGDMNMSRIIPNTIRLALQGESPLIWKGSEKSTREFLYVEDAVDGYLSLIENIEKTKGEAFNIGSGEIVTIEDLVNTILSKMDSHPGLSINYQEKDFPEISHQYLSSDKIKQYTGWTPKTKLNEGIDYCIKTYKNIL